MKRYLLLSFLLLVIAFSSSAQNTTRLKVLAFYSTKVESAHVDFAKELSAYLSQVGVANNFTFDATSDWSNMNEALLKNYQAVVWINDYPRTEQQRAVFQKYMDNGGAWLGFHTSIVLDKNIKWPWFNNFIGGAVYSSKVAPALPARLLVDDTSHPVVKRVPPAIATPADEWLQWKPSPRQNKDVKVLVSFDEYNFPIGMSSILSSGDVPVVWTNTKYKMIYMGIGHNAQAVSDHLQNFLIADALLWLGGKK